ncbi:pseudouridine synthase [Dokdonella koreensis]|uniref:Pseudouridine synthase n=1 Tax=Dokdonella koreensis DS-123 TaxID=1300342 RepID=A0A160DUT7_9GAMM|nr:pseudouridine synthase [Dokdonella koreensis]ANB17860.1 Ribosomal large subunit pseudouridine synthase B [Dokdonella koreensis DS-123]
MTTPRSVLSLKRNDSTAPALEERLHKVLATAGLGSRRLLEQRIESGEVQVNGGVATLGSGVRIGDRVEIDGKRFVVVSDSAEQAQVLVYNKPEGVVITREDPEGRPTVFEQLPRIKGARWIAVGRLDINTTGLLLLTTDGDLANALMHPRSELEREYICRVHGEVPDEVIERLRSGIELEDGPAHFDDVGVISRSGSHSWFRIVIREGRNREVRRMWESQGLMVSRLKRVRYANVELPRLLKRGQSEPLDAQAVRKLRDSAGAPESAPRLTLAPVIGQRRATTTEFRPDPKTQQAWTAARNDEAREFAAFDRIRDDGWRAPSGKPGKKRRPGAGPGAGPRGPGGPGGRNPNQRGPGARPGGPRSGKPAGAGAGKPRRAPHAPQPQHANANPAFAEPGINPAVLRSWFPDAGNGPGRKPRRGPGPGQAVPHGSFGHQDGGNRGSRDGNRAVEPRAVDGNSTAYWNSAPGASPSSPYGRGAPRGKGRDGARGGPPRPDGGGPRPPGRGARPGGPGPRPAGGNGPRPGGGNGPRPGGGNNRPRPGGNASRGRGGGGGNRGPR